jgi:hypothetical protein
MMAWLVRVLIIHTTAALTVALSPGRDSMRPDLGGPARYLVAPLALWDGGWYRRIVLDGYGDTQETAAFWPAYPALVRALSSATGLSPESSGVLISNLAFLGGLIALQRLVTRSYGESVAMRAVWLVALNPVAFFFSAFYTESLFLLLSIGAILFARRGRWTRAALLALLATLTRSAGLLVILPMAVALIEQVRRGERSLVRPGLQLAAAAAGPIAFAIYLHRRWGDPVLMIHAQERWGRRFSLPWESIRHGFRQTELMYLDARHSCVDGIRAGDWPTCRDALGVNVDSLSDELAVAAALIAIVLVPFVAWRLASGDALYGIAAVVLPLCSGIPGDPLVSLPRYLLVVYPLFIAAAMLVQRRWQFAITLVISTACLCWFVSIFARAWFVA